MGIILSLFPFIEAFSLKPYEWETREETIGLWNLQPLIYVPKSLTTNYKAIVMYEFLRALYML